MGSACSVLGPGQAPAGAAPPLMDGREGQGVSGPESSVGDTLVSLFHLFILGVTTCP